MLKVTVAEVQRAILKQFGINLGAVINSGNFATALLSQNALPITAAAGLGTLPLPGVGTEALDPTTGPTLRDLGRALQLQQRHSRQQRLRQLGRDQLRSPATTCGWPTRCGRSSATASCARWPSPTSPPCRARPPTSWPAASSRSPWWTATAS